MGRLTSDLTGRQFRRLTVLGPAGVHITASGNERRLWRVRCSCKDHTELVILDIALQGGRKVSCGCLRAERLALRAEQLDDLPSRTQRRVTTARPPDMTASQVKALRAAMRRRAARGESTVTQPTAT
jgi:hypothetical protein